MPEGPVFAAVTAYLRDLQDRLWSGLGELDPDLARREDGWTRPEGGGGRSRAAADGAVFEKAGINFADVSGAALPAAASTLRPALAGRPFRAAGVSLVIHPRNPFVPTTHLNVRFLETAASPEPVWWCGGGFDLTPCYGFREDAADWHRAARAACLPHGGEDLYRRAKEACDRYFFLPHRGETRGVGGLFFDDYAEGGFAAAFAFLRAVGDAFWPAYAGLVARRRDTPWGERQRHFQLLRRGRYVEFNLLHDRGTFFGLQSGGRTESILLSLPPLVRWDYDWQPPPGSPEEALTRDFLRPRDWLAEEPGPGGGNGLDGEPR